MRRILIPVIVLTILAGSACSPFSAETLADRIAASGTIEAEEVTITAEVGGRITELTVAEGDEVEAGQVLVQLDRALLTAQMRQAEAALEAAQANLARVRAGARPEEIAAAEAALAQSEAVRDGAYEAWQNALAMRHDPQELNARIDQARAQLEMAEHKITRAQADLEKFRVLWEESKWGGSDEEKTEHEVYGHQVRAAEEALEAAKAERDGAQRYLDDLLAIRDNPLELDTQVNAAKAEYQAAQAAVEVARAALDALRAGPTKEEVAIAQAQVSQAETALGVLQAQLDKTILRSPVAGLVTSKSAHVGEMASPGASLLTVADLERVKLTVYIPEDQIGRVKIGQPVEVKVDSYPGQTFAGRVVFIASQAEFTPKNIQTKEERVNIVFAVKIELPNPHHELKPGMPADAEISTD